MGELNLIINAKWKFSVFKISMTKSFFIIQITPIGKSET